MAVSRVRQNFSEAAELGVNKQINMELTASYVYQAMAFHFDRDDIALKNISEYFKKNSEEEREHAQILMKFQNQRGGRIIYEDIKSPVTTAWTDTKHAMEDALALERKVNDSLLKLHVVASEGGDAQMADFLESHFLTEQVEAIKELSGHITNLERVGGKLGEYIFDKEFNS